MATILMAAGEGLPFIKSGGLADVIGSLAPELVKKGHEVRVVMPLYKKIAEKYHQDFYFEKEYSVSINYHEVPVRLFSIIKNNVVFYFIEHQGYFERDSMYGYDDDGERFAYFQKAVIEMLNQLNYWPQIIHCHDWHTGMIPCMCKEGHSFDERYRNIRHVYTIHNMAYQGNFGVEMLDSCLGLGYYLFDNGNVRYDGGISFMKSGILYADKVTTVSPSYSQEILTPQYGEHLEMVLNMRKYDLWGIVNGIDIEMWNPMDDPEIPYHYNKVNVEKQKKETDGAAEGAWTAGRSECHAHRRGFPPDLAEGLLSIDGKAERAVRSTDPAGCIGQRRTADRREDGAAGKRQQGQDRVLSRLQ